MVLSVDLRYNVLSVKLQMERIMVGIEVMSNKICDICGYDICDTTTNRNVQTPSV